jgi:hypothetical protein
MGIQLLASYTLSDKSGKLVMKKLLTLALLLPINAFAGGWSGISEIETTYQRECVNHKDFEITFKADHNNPDNCTNKRTVNLSCDHAAYETIVSSSLVAFSSDSKVNIWLAGCDSEGQANVSSMRLSK